VRMTLRVLSLFLVGSILMISQNAYSLRQKENLFIFVLNSSDQDFQICNVSFTFCRTINPNENYRDAQVLRKKEEPEFFVTEWFDFWVIKLCNKVVPIKNMILPPMKRKEGDKTIYHLIIPQEYYDRECKQ